MPATLYLDSFHRPLPDRFGSLPAPDEMADEVFIFAAAMTRSCSSSNSSS